jgi:hypothetical protein
MERGRERMSDVSDRERFEFEREKWRADIAMRSREVAVKENEQASSKWRSPLVVAILAATAAAVGNSVVTVLNGGQQVRLENSKAESTRILEMIKTGDPEAAARNLDFLLNSGLVSDPDKRIASFLQKRPSGTGPALPALNSDALVEGLRQSVDKILQDYISSLNKLGFPSSERVTVKIEPTPSGPNAYYQKPNTMQIDPKLASDRSVPLREYNHHVLTANDKEAWEGHYAGIESGVADYLACSYLNNPKFGELAAKVLGIDRPFIRNIANDRNFDDFKGTLPFEKLHDVGEVWSGAFWAMRTALGRDVSDSIVVTAWRSMKWPAADAEKPLAFTSALLAAAGQKGPESAKAVRSILQSRHFPLPN